MNRLYAVDTNPPCATTRTFDLTEVERRIIANSLAVNALCLEHFKDGLSREPSEAALVLRALELMILDDLALDAT